ncbi:MAG: phage major capsid protein [Anaerolineae bacterium]
MAAPGNEETRTIEVAEAAIASQDGPRTFQVTILQAGPSRNGLTYAPSVLEEAANLFEGATAFVDHADLRDLQRGTRSVRDVAGAYGAVAWDPERAAIVGSLHLIRDEVAQLLAAYVTAREEGRPVPDIGISADLTVTHREGLVTRIVRVHSADIVFGPAAGGAIHRALQSTFLTPLLEEELPMSHELNPNPPSAPAPSAPEPAGILPADLAAIRLSLSQDLLRARLSLAGDLPQAARDEIRRRFEGRAFEAEELDAALASLRRMLAEVQGNPVQGYGAGRVQVTMNPLDRIQLAADRLFGVQGVPDHAPRLSGIRELYLTLTGDEGMTGVFNPEGVRIAEANVTTSTFTSVVKNALNKVLLQAYNVRPRWWEPIAWQEDFDNLNQITWMKTGGIGDLPSVSEGDAYTELSWSDTEETASFVKKGGYIGITLEAIDRDNVAALRRAPRELGNAAWRTLSGLVAALFTANSGTGPQMSDGYYLFDATHHANLRTAALSLDEWGNVVTAMFEQQEPTSGKSLAIRPAFCLVPIELEKTALTLLGSPNAPGTGDNDINPYYRTARVIVVPEWTDANNWAAAADPNDCPGICIGYRYGRQPELFVADQPLVGSMFTNDEIRLKVRFFLAVGVADYRPLHKNNVA